VGTRQTGFQPSKPRSFLANDEAFCHESGKHDDDDDDDGGDDDDDIYEEGGP
jgi:hypothetical protein